MGGYRARGALATLALASVVLVAVIAAGTISMQPLLPGPPGNTPTNTSQEPRQVVVVPPPASNEPAAENPPPEDRDVAGDEELIPVPDVLIPLDPILRPVPPTEGPQPPQPTDPTVTPTEPVAPTEPPIEPGPIIPTPPVRGGNGGVKPPDPTPHNGGGNHGNNGKPKPDVGGPKPRPDGRIVIPADPAIPGVRPARPASPASSTAKRKTARAFSSSPVVVIRSPRGSGAGGGGNRDVRTRPHRSDDGHAVKRHTPKPSKHRGHRANKKHKATIPHRHGRRRGHHRRS